MRALVLALPLLLLACGDPGPDLPEGWEEAEPIADFSQSDCSGDPLDSYETTIQVQVQSGGARIDWNQQPFRCDQPLEGFLRRNGAVVDVLVQPVDLMPDEVARCDCLYDLDLGFNVSEEVSSITFFSRRDEVGGASSPVTVGTVNFGG